MLAFECIHAHKPPLQWHRRPPSSLTKRVPAYSKRRPVCMSFHETMRGVCAYRPDYDNKMFGLRHREISPRISLPVVPNRSLSTDNVEAANGGMGSNIALCEGDDSEWDDFTTSLVLFSTGAKLRSKSTGPVPVLTTMRSKFDLKTALACLLFVCLFFRNISPLIKFYFSNLLVRVFCFRKTSQQRPSRSYFLFISARDEHGQRAGVVSPGLLLPSRRQRGRLGNGSGRCHEAPAVSGPRVVLQPDKTHHLRLGP